MCARARQYSSALARACTTFGFRYSWSCKQWHKNTVYQWATLPGCGTPSAPVLSPRSPPVTYLNVAVEGFSDIFGDLMTVRLGQEPLHRRPLLRLPHINAIWLTNQHNSTEPRSINRPFFHQSNPMEMNPNGWIPRSINNRNEAERTAL